MNAIPNFENFDMNETVTAVGFGMSGIQNVGLGGTSPQTGYSMSAIAGTVGQSADAIGAQAHTYETNDNSDHTAKGYIAEAKKHVNESIDKAYESCKAMDEGKSLTEAMVQVAGSKKPAGAQVLATVIIDYLEDNLLMPSNANKKKITEEIKQLIINSTF